MKQKLIPIVMMLLLATGVAQAAEYMTSGVEAGKWTQDLDAATKYAAEKDLPMMVMFTGSDWCFWCKLMDKDVFSAETFFKFAADKLVLVAINYPKDKSLVPEEYKLRNKQLGEQFKVRGVPTYVILASDGKTELGRLSAGKGKTPESFIKEVMGVLGK